MIDDSHTAHEPHPTAAMDRQYRELDDEYAKLWQMYGELEAERDRLRELVEDPYKISVCYFPAKNEIEATWEDAEGTRVMVTFPVDTETGKRLAEIVPCCVYHDAIALQEDGDE